MGSFKGIFNLSVLASRKESAEIEASRAAAIRPVRMQVHLSQVRDLSPTNACVLSEERYVPGTPVLLTICHGHQNTGRAERHVNLRARATRWGKDGVTLSFDLPNGMDSRRWVELLHGVMDETQPQDIVGQFRMASAMAFLLRICPSREFEAWQLIRNRRFAGVAEILLKALAVVDEWPDAAAMRAHPQLVSRILQAGSWIAEDWIQDLWAGLLVGACSADGTNLSNVAAIDALSQLTPMQLRVFTTACRTAKTYWNGEDGLTVDRLVFSGAKISEIAQKRDLFRIDEELRLLSGLGLMEQEFRSYSFQPMSEANVTPTYFGLDLFARCNGHRGPVEEFYGFQSAASAKSKSLQAQSIRAEARTAAFGAPATVMAG